MRHTMKSTGIQTDAELAVLETLERRELLSASPVGDAAAGKSAAGEQAAVVCEATSADAPAEKAGPPAVQIHVRLRVRARRRAGRRPARMQLTAAATLRRQRRMQRRARLRLQRMQAQAMAPDRAPSQIVMEGPPLVRYQRPADLVLSDMTITSLDNSLAPGLTIPDVDMTPEEGVFVAYNLFQISATLTNAGDVDIAERFEVQFQRNGDPLYTLRYDGLAGRESITVRSCNLLMPTAGSYNISVVADAGEDVDEFDDLHNSLTQSIRTQDDFYTMSFASGRVTARMRNAARDGFVSRDNMMDVFRSTLERVGDTVSADELSDLQRFVAWGQDGYYDVPDDVLYFADKIANGARANAWFQGGALGNLTAGSSEEHMRNLIAKWFLGEDRPAIRGDHVTAGVTYQLAGGSLIVGGCDYTDVDQNELGDCYFLAAIASLAAHDPARLEGMFTDNGDDTWTVRFYHGSAEHYVTVDRYLPTGTTGSPVYAGVGGSVAGAGGELWVALAEKAYAQFNEMDLIGQDGTNSYGGIAGGQGYNAIEHISTYDGQNMHSFAPRATARQLMKDAMAAGRPVGVNDRGEAFEDDSHAYSVVEYDPVSEMFQVYNPHGHMAFDGNWVTFDEIDDQMESWWLAT